MKPTETLSNKHQQVILTTDLERDLTMAIAECEHDRIFVIADRNTHAHCMGRLSTFRCLRDVITITIEPSDAHKDLTTPPRPPPPPPPYGNSFRSTVPRATRWSSAWAEAW